MSAKRVVASVAAAMIGFGASAVVATPAHAGGRPTNVAFVQAWKKVYLHHDGSITVTAGVRCKPGWEGGELSMQVNQGASYGSGFLDQAVPCDNGWHPLRFRISSFFGSIGVGPVTISSQFLITNLASGDSAGGHDVGRAGHVLRGHPATG